MTRDFPAEIANSSSFSGRKQVISKKKRSPSQERHKIWCQSTKNTNLDLDLRSRSPEPVNFFGAQSSLGGAQFSFGGAQAVSWGARPRYAPRGAGSVSFSAENTRSTTVLKGSAVLHYYEIKRFFSASV